MSERTGPDYADSPHPVRDDIALAHRASWDALARPGAYWSGAQRLAIAGEVRAARAQRNEPPWSRTYADEGDGRLPAKAIDAARTLAVDAHKLDRAWAEETIAALGAGCYVELVGVVAQVSAIDAFAEALGEPLAVLPSASAGDPSGEQPEGLGDIGAFVPMSTVFPGPNVGRALSFVPLENQLFFGLVGSMYALRDFTELVWDRPLSRAQVELVAARVSAVNECFY